MKKLIYIFALLTILGCTTTKYIEVPVVHKEFISKTDTVTRVDSIINEKATIIRELDSVAMAEFGIQLHNKEKAFLIEKNSLERKVKELSEHKVDTVVVRDSIPYPVEVTKEVPRKVNWLEQTLMSIGTLVVLGIIFSLIRYFLNK